MKLWQKHLLSMLTKTFLFFFLCIFGIYVTVDLSVHGVIFFAKSNFFEVALFYLKSLAAFFELFLSLAFLLALLRTLTNLTAHRETLALQMAGLSKKRLLVPFFLFALLLSLACYANNEWFAPSAQDNTLAFKGAHKEKKQKAVHLYSISLKDNSDLVYQSFDEEKQELFDVFWIRSPQEIWHMKQLQINPPRGTFVNHLARSENKLLEKKESFETRDFPEIIWDDQAVLSKYIPNERRPISALCAQALNATTDRASLFSHLYYKLVSPLTPFLILLAIAPLTMRFARHRPLFLLIACSLFGLIALKVILDGLLILGENQVIPASIAILAPVIILFCLLIPRFARLR